MWLVYFCLFFPPFLPSAVGPEARDQFRMEESWCLAWGAFGHRFCHCSTAATCPPPSPLCPHPQLLRSSSPLGRPLLPRLPNEEWHASGGSDLVHNWALASSVLSPIIDSGGSHWVCSDECAVYPRGISPKSKGGGGGGSKGRCNCMDSSGPNCLYSWASWLILGKKWDS